jgi:hypothetical protein
VKWAQAFRAGVGPHAETYFRYYNMSFLLVEAWLRTLYRKCDALVAPSVDGAGAAATADGMTSTSGRAVWTGRYSILAAAIWLANSLGIEDDMPVIGSSVDW